MAVDMDGRVYGWGYNGYYNLGDSTRTNRTTISEAQGLPKIAEVEMGVNYSLAIAENGDLYSWGYNGYGNLGDGTKSTRRNPVKVSVADGTPLTNVEAVSAGSNHAFAKLANGTMFGWGDGANYKFGNQSTAVKTYATQITYDGDGENIQNVLVVSGGYNHSAMAKEDGTVWTVGKNNYGQCGDKTTINESAWVCISEVRIHVKNNEITLPKIGATEKIEAEVSLGFNLLYNTGKQGEYSYKSMNEEIATVNDSGVVTGVKRGKAKIALTENTLEKTVYVDVYVLGEGDIAFPSVKTYASTTVALKADGTVWTWGYGGDLGLGYNETANQTVPVKVPDLDNVIKIAVGSNHVLALKKDGTVWAWGLNAAGQLGRGSTTAAETPIQVRDASGYGYLTGIKHIAAGNQVSMAIDNDGNLYTWGLNGNGQLGINNRTNQVLPVKNQDIMNVRKMSAGYRTAYALTDDGKLYGFGYNGYGQIGDGTKTQRLYPVEVQNVTDVIDIVATSSEQAFALRNDGSVYAFGNSTLGATTDVGGAIPRLIAGPSDTGSRMKNAGDIAGGYNTGAVITADNKVLAWGLNGYGQLGNGSKTNISVPTTVMESDTAELSEIFLIDQGDYYSIFAKTDGSVWTVGYGANGELGNSSTSNLLIPENISTDYIHTDKTEVTIKGVNGTDKVNATYICGFNLYDYTKSDNMEFTSLDENIATVDNQGNITAKGIGKTYITIKASGLARRIEVNVINADENAVMDLQSGNKHTVGLKANGTLWSFGANNFGQLGNKVIDNNIIAEPAEVTGVPEGETYTKIAVGGDHTIALGKSGKVYTWGANGKGQLGNGSTANSPSLIEVSGISNVEKIFAYKNKSFAIITSGELYAWGEGYGLTPQKINFFSGIIDISGNYVLSEYGTVWNLNDLSQKVPELKNVAEISSGLDHLIAIDVDGKAYGMGGNAYGQVGIAGTTKVENPSNIVDSDGNAIKDIVNVEAGDYISYFRMKNGDIYSFGKNNSGELGLGDSGNVIIPTKINLSGVEKIHAGLNSAYAIEPDGTVYSWGANANGQLGQGDKQDRNVPTKIGGTKIITDPEVVKIEVGSKFEINASLNNIFNLRTDVIRTTGFEYKAVNKNTVSIDANEVTGTASGLTTVIVKDQETQETSNIYVEVVIPEHSSAVQVVSGKDFSIALRYDGSVWGWGVNTAGQVGDNTFNNKLEPVEMTGRTVRAKQVATGIGHTLVLLEDGTVMSSGLNENGQLGMGSTVNQKTLTYVMDENGNKLENIVRVSANGNTSYALNKNGEVYVFGEGAYKAATKVEGVEKVAELSEKYAITADGKVIDLTSGKEITGITNIIKVVSGENHTLFLTNEGKVYAYGQNTNGQCGTGTKVNSVVPTLVKDNVGISELSNIIDIAAGNNYSVAVDKDGNLYTWGSNSNGCIGKETTADQLLPKKNIYINDVMLVTAGTRTVTVAKKDGTVWAFGNNELGQLGNGITENTYVPVQIGEDSLYVESNHVVVPEFGTFELKGGMKNFNLIKDVTIGGVTYETGDTGVAIVDGTGKITGVNEGNGIIVVKANGTDQKAIVRVDTVRKGTEIKPMTVTAGSHQVILRANGEVWTYGDNTNGELGDNTKISKDTLCKVNFAEGTKIKEIAAGDNHVLALDLDGNVWAWGRNNNSQVGVSAVEVLQPVKLELGAKAVKISAGYNQSFAITEDNKLIAWGLNSDGQLGLGTNEIKLAPTMVQNVKDVLDVAVGKTHVAIIRTNGEVYTSGNNSYGSLTGTISKRNRFAKVENLNDVCYISSGEYHNIVITLSGKVYTWGGNTNGQLGTGDTSTLNTPYEITGISNVKQVSAGRNNSFIRTKSGEVYAAGSNTFGELGNGDNSSIYTFEKINNLTDVFSISSGNTYSMIIKNDGSVWGFGDYYHGLSNVRTETNSNIPVKVGSDNFLIKNRDMVIQKNNAKDIEIQEASNFNVWEDQNKVANYTFTSLNEITATVDNAGRVTGKEIGTTWVKVKNTITNETQVAIIRVAPEDSIVAPVVTGGENFGGVLKADGSIWSYGYNSNGELGIGSYVGKDIPQSIDGIKTYTSLKAGNNFMIALRNDGTVWSFGRNQNGELGLGNRDNQNVPTQIKALSNITKITTGRRHAVALDSFGDVYVWGGNSKGQLGLPNTSSIDVPTKLNLGDVDVIDIAAGENITVIVLSDGKLMVFGEGKENLAYGKVGNAVRAEVGNEIIVLTTGGNVTKVGNTLSTIYSNKDAVDISAKSNTYMVLNNNGELYNFGTNSNGELGLKNTNLANSPTKVDFGEQIISIGAGVNNSYIVAKSGLVYASGLNTYGSLGNETKDNSTEYVLVGAQTFELEPDNLLMTVGDTEDIVNIEVKSDRFNVFREDKRDINDFEWVLGDSDIAEVINTATIKAKLEGETTLTVACKETGAVEEVIVVVIPVDKDRLEKLQVNEVEAKVTGILKYEVTIETEDNTGKLLVETKDKTDKISIDGGQSWFENGKLEYDIQLPDKENVFNILVEITNGEQVEYELKVIKQSGNLDLINLNVNDVPGASTGSTTYIAICESDSAVVYAKTANENAKVSIDNDTETVNEGTKSFDMTNTLMRTVPIKVISESGKEIVYTLTIYKETALMDLEKVTVDGEDATKTSLLEYSIIVPRDKTEVELYVKALYELAGVNINNLGEEIPETTRKITLTGESTTVKIKVCVEELEREYTLTIQKEPDASALGFVYVNGVEVKPNGNKYEAYVGVTDTEAEVFAIAAVNTSTVQIGANTAEVGSSKVKVVVDADKVTYIIRVTDAENMENTQDYELIIRRPSADNSLKQITVGNTNFSETANRVTGTNKYTVTIDEKYKDFVITAETNYDLAKVKIAENVYQAHIDTYGITGFVSPNTYIITVEAQDGTEAEYELEVRYTSNNNNIKKVTVDGNEAVLSTEEANTYIYTMTNKNETVSVYALMEDENAEIALNNILYEKKEITKLITRDSKEVKITINVRAENGETDVYYLIIKALPDNTNIDEISIGDYKAVAVPYTDKYEIKVPKTMTEYPVRVTLEDVLAKASINENAQEVGTTLVTVAKAEGKTIAKIKVTAQDGTEAEYELDILEMSDDTALSFVKIDGNFVEANEAGEYRVKVLPNKESVLADVETADENAKVGIQNAPVLKSITGESLTVTADTNTYTITVIAEDGTTKEYPLIIEKMSSNADMIEVYVEGTKIEPDENGKYEASVGNLDEAELKVVVDENAIVSVNGETAEKGESTREVSVTEEEKIVTVVVTAEDGTEKTHTILLKKFSSDTTLLEISADGIDTDKITQTGEDTYQMIIAQGMNTLDLTAVTTSTKASVKIEDNNYEVNTTTKTVSVPDDENTVKITVKAENGDEKEFTLTIVKKYELTIDSITVNTISAIEKDGEYIAFIDRDEETSHVVITTTNSNSVIDIKDVANGAGKVEFDLSTPDEEKRIPFIVSSPLDDDKVEYTLVIKKKSNDTSLEWVKNGEKVATEEEERYILKVPEGTEPYVIEVKTTDEYAKVRIEDNTDDKTQFDTYTLDLSGMKEKEITVYVTAQNGDTKAHKVLVQKNSDDSTIKKLAVDNKELTAENGTYKVFVKEGTENIDLYIETTNDGALIKIDAEETETKHILNRQENIGGSNKTYTITVTAEDGTTSRYTLEVGIESDDVGLEFAKIKENKEEAEEKTAIQKEDNLYYVTAPAGASELIITARTANQYATVSINGEPATVHDGVITYTVPTENKVSSVTITVTAQNGVDTAEYTLQIESVSNDTTIAKITVDGELVTTYDEGTKTYDIVVDYEKEDAAVYVETTNEYATVRISAEDPELYTSTKTVNIPNTENVIDITVIAEDGTSEVRHLNIRKLSRETAIIRMVVNGKNAQKAEDDDLNYTATIVESDINAITQIFVADVRSKVKIGETEITDPTGDGYLTAINGQRQIVLTITVEAEDTRFTADYTLTINVVSDNKDLKTLTVAGITLGAEDYDEETSTYTAFIPVDSTSAIITAETVSEFATTRIDETEGTNTITYTQVVDSDPKTAILTVTAEDNTSKAYTIVMKQISTDNTLMEVRKDGTLVSADENDNYSINVPEDTEKLELYAKASNEYATVSIDGKDAEKQVQTKEITLTDKVTTVIISVTAQNGDKAEYTVTITKVSNSTELEWIKVNGNNASLNEETGEYEAIIPSNMDSAEVIVQTKNNFATVGIGDDIGTKILTTTVDTTENETKVVITVTSEDGDEATYNLTIRKISTDATAIIYVDGKAVTPDEDGNYIAKVVETATEATVKVVPNNEYATAEIEGFDPEIKETEHKVTLDSGDTTNVNITVTAQDNTQENITLTIIKVSDDVSIKELMVGDEKVNDYDSDTKTYSIYIDEESNLNNILGEATSGKATIVVDGVSGIGTAKKENVDTSAEKTTITITVKSEYGTSENYTLNIMKKSSDASILELRVNDSEPLTAPYEITVKNSDTDAKIYVKTTDENATIKIGEGTVVKHENTQSVTFPEGANEMTVIVTVTSQDGKTVKEYPVKITKQSNNTGIKQILVNGEEVEINDNLEAIIKNVDISELKVVLENENAEVGIDGSTLEKGSITKNVSTPVTTIRTITVKAEDGTVKEYQITLIKKFTITGKITDEFITDEHIATVTVFQTADTRDEDDEDNPREVIYESDTEPDGTFELILDSGKYDVRIRKPGYLTHRITEIELSGNKGVELGTKDLIAGDVVRTGDINIGDLTSMNNHYKKDVTKYPEYDLNGDGKIDLLDRKIITKNFGKTMITEIWVDPDAERENPGEEKPIEPRETSNPEGEKEAKEILPEEIEEVSTYTLAEDNNAMQVEEAKKQDFILPIACDYIVTSEAGGRTSPTSGNSENHAGIDLRGTHHTNVMAVRDGEVTFAGVQRGYGYCVEIKHEYNGKTIYSFYAHLSKVMVEKGQTVKQGDVIGLEGGQPGVDENYGDSTGHHLHFEIRTASSAKYAVNPREYIDF